MIQLAKLFHLLCLQLRENIIMIKPNSSYSRPVYPTLQMIRLSSNYKVL
nr:MAG TPA: hypothetical protein [Caudoviricetes sp.]